MFFASPAAEPVASLAEAWIETPTHSLPSDTCVVASLAEAWIETRPPNLCVWWLEVASLAEAWIETNIYNRVRNGCWSPPSRRRGLKRVAHSITLI